MKRYTIHPHNSGGYNCKPTLLEGDEVVVLLDDAEAAIEAARDEGYRQGKEEWEEANAAEYWRGKREGRAEEREKVEEKLQVAREALSVIANKEMAAAGSRAATRLIAREALAKIGGEK